MSGPAPAYAKHGVGTAALAIAIVFLTLVLAGCSEGSGSDDEAAPAAMGTVSATSSTQPATSGPVDPTTTTVATGPTEPPPTGNTRADFVTAIAQSLRRTVPVAAVSDEQVDCVAQISVDAIGLPAFTSRDLSAADVASPTFSFSTLGMELATANKVVDAYATCGVDMRALIQVAIAALVKPIQAECVNSKVDDAFGRQILTELLAYGSYTSEMQAKMRAVGRECGIKLN